MTAVLMRQPEMSFRRDLPLMGGNTFVRGLTARVLAAIQRSKPDTIAASMWPSDRLVAQLFEQRAAVAPAMTSVAGWAAELAQRVVADAIKALGGVSAGAELLGQGLVLGFDGPGSISVPNFAAAASNASFVAEGNPIPVRQLGGPAALLEPHKLAVIAVLTREMAESSNAEQLIGDTFARSAGLALDLVLFDSNAGSAARPAGLRNGVAALPPSNNSDFAEAWREDVAALVSAVAAVAGNGPIALVAPPGVAALGLRTQGANSRIMLFGASALTTDVIAVAPAALVAALDPEPAVEVAKASTLVMDTAPGAAGTMGPERSMWQADSLAVKMRWPVTWALRDPRGVAWLTPAWK